MTATLTDQSARDRIRNDTGSTLFVDAGAGSGKTKSLIDRVTTLALVDGVSLRNVAAVTFTEKAGAELRDRLRANFEKVWKGESAERPSSEEDRERAAAALDDLDGAAIGTLHSFAQRILTMHPIEAGLPPLVEVLDEVGSSVAFDGRWSVMQREMLDDESMAQSVRLALAAGVKLEHLRSLARAFQSDWDLIEDRVLPGGPPTVTLPDVRRLLDEARLLAARGGECADPDDKFLARLTTLTAWADEYADATEPELHLAGLLSAQRLGWSNGRKGNWGGALTEIRDSCKGWQQQAAEVLVAFTDATLRPLAYWVADKVRAAALARAAEGRLEFHDLLVVTRDLLRRDESVRAALREQYPRLLLDEFQDTDPIQIEIAVRIAGGADASAANWRDVRMPAGSLFVVGDPKQSIYRFRRADIGMYLDAQQWIGVDQTVTLSSNFRTVAPVLGWVNEVFDRVIEPVERAQPAYVALKATRDDNGTGAPVVVLGAEAHDDKPNAAVLREREASDVAAVIRQALAEGWMTWDERKQTWRRLELGDIAILVPARTSLPFLEDALDTAKIPYRAESSSLVYQASEVRDLLAAARVVADPSDLLACVTALRSPLFGCGDDDLWSWKRAGGSFNILAPVRDKLVDHQVGRGVAYLKGLHDEARWMAPSEVLGAVIADRRMLEVAATGQRSPEKWRRLRFVVDQARAWSETEHGGLRAYLAWAARQGEETARVAEAVLPETDVDAVRVMTVHAAKGLEFPMVVLSGLSSASRNNSGVRVLWTNDGYAVRLTKSVQTNDFENVAPLDEQMDAYERRRLLYVATTRARDHLVVSLHRKGSGSTNAELLADAGAGTAVGATAFIGGSASNAPLPARAEIRGGVPDWAEWLSQIEVIRAKSRLVSAVSASGLEGTEPAVALADDDPPGAAKGGRDIELPPWSKGRYGSAIGRAVHGVLQTINLSDGSGLDAAVSSQCIAEGVVEYSEVVTALVRSAFDSDVVKRAAVRPHWRESYVGTVQEDGTILEGLVDLIYREDDGSLVVVDYKTDAIPSAAVATRSQFYAPQIRAYLATVGKATDSRVAGQLLFLNPHAQARQMGVGD
ncbi:MAG: UvrD-helicase domain-containing protein [Nocardioidaceae bacterium]|nr:UvrD-helicase domain-containing protein [Nocardioidaceae bacterium]